MLGAAPSLARISCGAHIEQHTRCVMHQVDEPDCLVPSGCRKVDIVSMDCKSSLEIVGCDVRSLIHTILNPDKYLPQVLTSNREEWIASAKTVYDNLVNQK